MCCGANDVSYDVSHQVAKWDEGIEDGSFPGKI